MVGNLTGYCRFKWLIHSIDDESEVEYADYLDDEAEAIARERERQRQARLDHMMDKFDVLLGDILADDGFKRSCADFQVPLAARHDKGRIGYINLDDDMLEEVVRTTVDTYLDYTVEQHGSSHFQSLVEWQNDRESSERVLRQTLN